MNPTKKPGMNLSDFPERSSSCSTTLWCTSCCLLKTDD